MERVWRSMTEGRLKQNEAYSGLPRYLSPLGAWSLSIGTSIGWGSFVITSNTYLAGAGPLGSALGILAGAAVMLLIAANYHYMMRRCPEAGGVYSYVKSCFGHGVGFLVAWFLSLTYFAMLWANATSLPLFSRYFLGEVFCFGRLYTIFGYEVWFGEALISILALLLAGCLCMRRGRLALRLNTALALVFTLGITVCFAAAMLSGGAAKGFQPHFVPDGSVLRQVTHIAYISPWAFIGFENISHAVEEFRFPAARGFRVMTVSVVITTLLYIFVTLLSVTAYPPEYASWLEYIRDLDNIAGIGGLPAFYAAQHYLGDMGIWLLMLSLLALIITSLIGNTFALSRLLFALARDRILPPRFARLSRRGAPENAILAVVLFSLFVPFLGRVCIGWIVDVTTVGATMVYGVISAAVLRTALREGQRSWALSGGLGLTLMVVFGFLLLLPNLLLGGSMEQESYFIFILWSILGLFFFRHISVHDPNRRFESAIHVWIALLSMIVFMAVVWMGKMYESATMSAILAVRDHYGAGESLSGAELFITQEVERFRRIILRVDFSVLGLFVLSLTAMLWNYYNIRRTALETRRELGNARTLAYTDPLTGVKSKHAFVEREMDLDRRIDGGGVKEFALVVCDINGTKTVNDTLGHLAGDEYIRSGCALICRGFKASPVFRIGGDEFAVILEGVDYRRRQELLSALDAQMERNIGTGGIVAALGMAAFDPAADNTFRSVFERADREMYTRKKALKAMGADVRD